MDSYGKKAGKGALVQEEMSGTLGVSQDQYLFQPLAKSYGFCPQVGGSEYASLGMVEDRAPTLTVNQINGVVILNPYDSQDNQMTVAYGVTTKGNGDAFISKERHTSLSNGGGQAGQGYPCVCYGIDTYNQAAEEEIMQTIRTNGGGDCIPKVVYSIEKAIITGANCTAGGDCYHAEFTPPLTTDRPHAVVYSIENHPNDSRVQFSKDGKVQALTSRMGTGGGNVPLVLATQQGGAEMMYDKCPTITAMAGMSGNNQPVVVMKKGCYWDGTQVCGTLTAHNANGAQRMPDKENFTCVIQHKGGDISPKDRKPHGKRIQQTWNSRSDE